jgi:hypothetical protein
MSALEVLQTFPAQRRALFSSISGIDPSDVNTIAFDLETHLTSLPRQLTFQIQVIVRQNIIFRIFIDEGALACVMSLNYWKDIGSSINQSPNTLKSFDDRGFKPFGVLNALPIELEGKIVTVELEFVDAPLDYNLLLGRSWIYTMFVAVSTLFRVLRFPHQEKIVMVDQLAYFTSDSRIDSVPFIEKTPSSYENVGVGILKDSSLMGTFPLPPPDISPFVTKIDIILTHVKQSLESLDPLEIPGLNEHSSLSLSSSLKNETNPPLSKSSLPLDRVLEPYFPPPHANIPISIQMPKQGKKKRQRRKRCLGGRYPSSGHHVGAKPLDSTTQFGGEIALERHATRSDPCLGVVTIVT